MRMETMDAVDIKGGAMQIGTAHRRAGWSRGALVVGCLLGLGLPGLAWAQAGIGVTSGTLEGTIGHNKGSAGATSCPAGTLLTGMRHVDKAMTGAQSMTRGMTIQIDLYCSRIVVDGSNVTLEQTTPDGTPATLGFSGYAFPGTTQTGYCPAGTAVQQLGGSDRRTADSAYPVPWTSSMTLVCRPLSLDANGWLRVNGTANNVQVGVKENNATHNERGPFCTNNGTTVTTGYHRQTGGEGYDGVNIYCSGLRQARHSAVLDFQDFAWSQQRGGGGWMVTLAQGTTALAADALRAPHAPGGNIATQMQVANESFVIPGNNYRASLSQRPAGIAANTFHTAGSCLTGVALANEQDASCALVVTGLPDLRVSVTGPAATYTSPAMVQNITMTAANLGPGATDGDDGFALAMTLPTGWTIGAALPANCGLSGQVVSCQLNPTPLSAAGTPGGVGGSQSFAIPVRPLGVGTPATAQPVAVALLRAVPDGDSDPTNNDYNTANDTASTEVVLAQPTPFQSCPVDAFVTRGNDLYTLNLVTGVFTLQGPINAASVVNAIGFRQQDGYLWGWANGVSPSRLVRIGQGGEAQLPHATAPAGWGGWGSYAADIEPATGYYVSLVNRGPDSAPDYVLARVDVTSNAVVGPLLPSSVPGGGAVTDIAFHSGDGQLYSISSNGMLFRINPVTGASTPLGLQLPPNGPGGWGAIFFDNSGTMYAYKSNSLSGRGLVYRIFGIGGGSLAYDILTDADTSSNLDGARCPSAVLQGPPALLLRKQTSGAAGGPFIFSLTNTTQSSGTVTTTAADTPVVVNGQAYTVTAAGVGQPLTVSETTVPSGWRMGEVSCSSGGNPVTASVSGNAFTVPGSALGFGRLVECTVTNRRSASSLQLAKTSSATGVLRTGDSLQYTLVASNQGPDAADGAVLQDPAVSGVSCSGITCSASNGAQCPDSAGLTIAGLQGSGLVLPALPAGGSVTVSLQCEVTASGF